MPSLWPVSACIPLSGSLNDQRSRLASLDIAVTARGMAAIEEDGTAHASSWRLSVSRVQHGTKKPTLRFSVQAPAGYHTSYTADQASGQRSTRLKGRVLGVEVSHMGWVESGWTGGARAADWAYLIEPYARSANDALFDRTGVGPGTKLPDIACSGTWRPGPDPEIACAHHPRSHR
jgi:hypothetical protein